MRHHSSYRGCATRFETSYELGLLARRDYKSSPARLRPCLRWIRCTACGSMDSHKIYPQKLKGSEMRKSRLLATCLLSVFLCVTTLTAQANGRPTPAPAQVPDASQPDASIDPQLGQQRAPKSQAEERAERELEKERQKQRWQDIKKRSEQLLEVATELKQYVYKSGENVMSLEVIKKAAQMEKLSKELQKRMKGN